jgi:hypothetical protein
MSEVADASQTPSIPIPPPAPKNSFQRIAGVLFAPVSTFEDIARKPDVLVPMLLILIIGYVNTFLMMPRMDWNAVSEAQMEAVKAKNPQMTDADLERMSRMTQGFAKVAGWVGPLFGVIWWLILAGVLLLAFRLMGGQGTFKQALSTVLYSWIPMVIYYIVVTIVTVARGKIDPTHIATLVKSNPAFLVDMKEQPVLFSLLSNLDIFTIWMLVLLIIGCAAFSKTSRAKAAAIVLSLWAVMILVKTAFAAMAAAKMKVKAT